MCRCLHTSAWWADSSRASLTRVHRQAYARLYPVLLVKQDGSTINIRYREPRRILAVSFSPWVAGPSGLRIAVARRERGGLASDKAGLLWRGRRVTHSSFHTPSSDSSNRLYAEKNVLSKQAEEIFLKRSFEGREGEVQRPFWSLPLSICLPSTDASGLGRPLPRREAGAAPQT